MIEKVYENEVFFNIYGDIEIKVKVVLHFLQENFLMKIAKSNFPFFFSDFKSTAIFLLSVTPLCYYYVVNGTVYQCPDIYTFVQSKLIGAVDPLRRALEQARQFSRFNFKWPFFVTRLVHIQVQVVSMCLRRLGMSGRQW